MGTITHEIRPTTRGNTWRSRLHREGGAPSPDAELTYAEQRTAERLRRLLILHERRRVALKSDGRPENVADITRQIREAAQRMITQTP